MTDGDIYISREINYYNALPCTFDDFIDLPELSDGVIRLFCVEKRPAKPEKKLVPIYVFDIYLNDQAIGKLNLRIGYTETLYYGGGQIGYEIDEGYRGHGYVVRACKLAASVAKAHGMAKLLITSDSSNHASMRVCEKLGARLVRVVAVPEWHVLYGLRGECFSNIYEWDIEGL